MSHCRGLRENVNRADDVNLEVGFQKYAASAACVFDVDVAAAVSGDGTSGLTMGTAPPAGPCSRTYPTTLSNSGGGGVGTSHTPSPLRPVPHTSGLFRNAVVRGDRGEDRRTEAVAVDARRERRLVVEEGVTDRDGSAGGDPPGGRRAGRPVLMRRLRGEAPGTPAAAGRRGLCDTLDDTGDICNSAPAIDARRVPSHAECRRCRITWAS